MNHPRIKAVLAERRLTQWRLAHMLKMPPSTLSEYLRGTKRSPPNLVQRIERKLHLPNGALT